MKASRWGMILSVFSSVCAVHGAQEYQLTILHPPDAARSEALGGSAGRPVGWFVGDAADNRSHAAMWFGSNDDYVDLHPAGYSETSVWGASGDTQVGIGHGVADPGARALMWKGTAASVIDLHPAGFYESFARDAYGDQQIGHANAPQRQRAILWNGSADDYVNLHPEGFFQSIGTGVYGDAQVGYGDSQALLWSGSADSVVNLHPAGYSRSRANDVSATHAVGSAYLSNSAHAFLWSLDTADAVDLHPRGYSYSWGWAAAGEWQVGYGDSDGPESGGEHALVWQGSAASVVDLHDFVPPEYSASVALGVDSHGNVYGAVSSGDVIHDGIAVMWTPVPEPTSMSLLLIGIVLFGMNRKDRGKCVRSEITRLL